MFQGLTLRGFNPPRVACAGKQVNKGAKMPRRTHEFLFAIRHGVAEAVSENPQSLLSLDYTAPDRIVAFVSRQIHNEITKQLAKNPDLDGVAMGASLCKLIQEACEFLEDDDTVDSWVRSLEEAILRLQNYRRDREAALKAACETCAHQASEHYRPHVGDINCSHPDCACSAFAPLVRVVSRNQSGPQPIRVRAVIR